MNFYFSFHLLLGHPRLHQFLFNILSAFNNRQGLRLCKEVAHQYTVAVTDGIVRVNGTDEIARNNIGSLMDELIKCVLPIGPSFAKHNRSRLVGYRTPPFHDGLAVAFHANLLYVGREPPKIPIVEKHRLRFTADKVVAPYTNQRKKCGKVLFGG